MTAAELKRMREAYKNWLAQQPCVRCEAWPVILHHEDGCRSRKTGQWMRKRQNEADGFILPVCPSCHDDRHAIGRLNFEVSCGKGEGYLSDMVATYYCRFVWEGKAA